ncbi:hypothetical protein BCY86_01820 [Pajaroellobacter abortibovis]|uniref:Uncharacterized protein n=1 Tax=Pajaroellobacter abortibovis TaxID=1882918 RepID=A0A1L6MVK6_9BACT|nr:hypothetical protein BCY86_01820 [Pajaroellobacter abortibovis]
MLSLAERLQLPLGSRVLVSIFQKRYIYMRRGGMVIRFKLDDQMGCFPNISRRMCGSFPGEGRTYHRSVRYGRTGLKQACSLSPGEARLCSSMG